MFDIGKWRQQTFNLKLMSIIVRLDAFSTISSVNTFKMHRSVYV